MFKISWVKKILRFSRSIVYCLYISQSNGCAGPSRLNRSYCHFIMFYLVMQKKKGWRRRPYDCVTFSTKVSSMCHTCNTRWYTTRTPARWTSQEVRKQYYSWSVLNGFQLQNAACCRRNFFTLSCNQLGYIEHVIYWLHSVKFARDLKIVRVHSSSKTPVPSKLQ